VHVNTLYRRLERIDELLGAQWRAADRRLDLHLAIRLRRLMDRLDVVGS
jgi:DNA-binding PucR family transcriptional regulator